MSASPTTPDIVKVSILGKDSIHCGFHLSSYIATTVISTLPASTYVIVTDTNIAKLHLDDFTSAFRKAIDDVSSGPTPRFLSHVISPGETSKSRKGKAGVEDFLLQNSCTRDTVILALGGGVIGDLVGFVAATFMRGVRFVQIPTTLLAMVDSAVGGKTAIDTPHGKNLIGSFWQPEYVFIDASFLETLPPREFANGMAEVIKTAAIWNETEFTHLESRSSEIISAVQSGSTRDTLRGQVSTTRTEAQQTLLNIIIGSISVKAYIVTKDERETGLRNLVNFGHTVGHAIEAVLTPAILHGECVSVGMVLEAEIARKLGVLGQVAVGRLTRCIKAYGLPTTVADPRIAKLPAARQLTIKKLLDIMKIDKKNSGPQKKVVLLARIGKTHEERATAVDDRVIATVLAEACKVVPGVPKNDPVRMTTPGSKSISNRALVLAALGAGTCRLRNLLHSDDTQVMMAALMDLKGASFEWEDGGETLVVHGGQGSLTTPPKGKELYLGNAGTAARFLTTVCTLAHPSADASTQTTTITGNARMKQRPCGPLVEALQSNGSTISYLETPGCLPLAINEGFKGGHIQLAASVSSQYVSSILLCAPYASSPEGTVLELTGGQVISQPYIDMTIAMMATFGITVTRKTNDATGQLLDVYEIPKGTYTNPQAYNIESDASSATYPLAIAAITGTTCTIENIGSASLQGDAGFAKNVLEPMGCTVVQTETETTVTGPPKGRLRACGYVDMEPMTDAFLTASVLAAVATQPSLEGRRVDGITPNTTRILGIANQRVKECNRIRAMIDELSKFGVETKELDDGLEIYGKPIEELNENPSIHCYDDHRVAMAFSVLGTVVKGAVLEEKVCVGKTWPNWWDDLENKIGLSVEGVELDKAVAGQVDRYSFPPYASIILIGMRGAGKSYIGKLAATVLGLEYIDADDGLAEKVGMGLSQYVKEKGWPAFRTAELEGLFELLRTKPCGAVLSLGGGIVETPAAREALKNYRGPVVHVERDLEAIVKYLTEETARPPYGDATIEEVFHRREPWYAETATHQFYSYFRPDATEEEKAVASQALKAEIIRYFKHISGLQPNLAPNLDKGKRSYFLSLTYPDITPALSIMDDLTTGVDAVELRVDLLSASGAVNSSGNIPPLSYVATQLAALRQSTTLPIVFTVRTKSQGGAFPDTAEAEAFELMKFALRSGVEYVDVEITWSEKQIEALSKVKGFSKIIASWHDWSGGFKWTGVTAMENYATASRLGDIVKLVGKANKVTDNFELFSFVDSVSASPSSKPIIAINMGAEGQLSRILNSTFSPVSHPLLPTKAAPGQLSFAQIQTSLNLIGQLPAKQFYLFGSPIQHSPSPTLHNTGFQTLGLPHKFDLLETAQVNSDGVKAVLSAPDFGGAAVTIPCKLDVIQLLDGGISDEANAIGAVNTVIPRTKPDGLVSLHGDNTDWQAIRALAAQRLTHTITNSTTGLVIGAGGTSRAAIYALHSLGLSTIFIFNRTLESAKKLALSFPESYRLRVVDSLDCFPPELEAPSVVVGTVPAHGTSLQKGEAGVYLPPTLFTRASTGVVIDMAYKPAETPLLTLAKTSAPESWARVAGVELLLEQGYRQFELWTGRRAPRKVISEAVMKFYHS